MGRSLAGNSVSVAPVVLSRTLGNLNSGVRDSVTNSSSSNFAGNIRFGATPNIFSLRFLRNSVAEQRITSSSTGILQDELSDYSMIQTRGYSGSTGSYFTVNVVYDADLNIVYSCSHANPPFAGNLFGVRLYNSNLYFFSSSNNTAVVTRVALPSGTVSTTSFTLPGSGVEGETPRVFNYLINNKFYFCVSLGSNTPMSFLVLMYDVTTNAITQFGVTHTPTTNNYIYNCYAMHVNPAGTAVSIPYLRLNGGSSLFGTATFTSSAVSINDFSSTGHYNNGAIRTFGNNEPSLMAVTTDCIIDSQNIFTNGNNPNNSAVGHLRGGDTGIQITNFLSNAGTTTPISSVRPSAFLSLKDQAMLSVFTGSITNGQGTYQVARSGNDLTFAFRSALYSSDALATKLSSTSWIPELTVGQAGTTSEMWLSGLTLRSATRTINYTFSNNINNQVGYGATQLSEPFATSFVTSTGRFFSTTPYCSSNSTVKAITSWFPIFVPSSNKTYSVVVIGGGGASNATAGNQGESSSFETLAAANGTQRNGYVAGSSIITSGSLRGTGGTGYGADAWGQGEDATAAGAYGGGSGYVTLGTISVTAGSIYPYKAGLGSQFGKQGAVILAEV